MSDFDPTAKTPSPQISAHGRHRPRPGRKPGVPAEVAAAAEGEDFIPTALPRAKPAPPSERPVQSARAENTETEDSSAFTPGRKPQAPAGVSAVAGARRGGPPAEFAEAARSAARIAHVPFADVLAKAGQESNYNPRARSGTSSAAGPYQFIEQTWLSMLKRHGSAYGLGPEVAQIKLHNGVASVADPAVRKKLLDLRHDVHLSAGMAARYLDESGRDLGRILHRKPSDDEKRIAYFLGPGGAAQLIRAAQTDPNGAAPAAVPNAAEANRSMFYGPAGALSNHEAMQRITRFVSRNLRDAAALAESDKPLVTDRMGEDRTLG